MKRKLVHISFLDHVAAPIPMASAYPIEVVGWLVKEDKHGYTLCSWLAGNSFEDENSTGHYILKHKGLKLRVIR